MNYGCYLQLITYFVLATGIRASGQHFFPVYGDKNVAHIRFYLASLRRLRMGTVASDSSKAYGSIFSNEFRALPEKK